VTHEASRAEPVDEVPTVHDVRRSAPTPVQLIADYRQAFESEGVDPRWATDSRYTLLTNLQADSSRSGQIVDVECRTRQCMVTLQWDDYERARRDVGSYVTQPYGMNCNQQMALGPRDPRGTTAEGYLFFDCRGVPNDGRASAE
jgi:hypothetical protein